MSFLDRMCELEISGMIAAISREATMAHLKLFILGQPRLERDSRPLELSLRKALALLMYLEEQGLCAWHSQRALRPCPLQWQRAWAAGRLWQLSAYY
jgi:hypothetical protein